MVLNYILAECADITHPTAFLDSQTDSQTLYDSFIHDGRGPLSPTDLGGSHLGVLTLQAKFVSIVQKGCLAVLMNFSPYLFYFSVFSS